MPMLVHSFGKIARFIPHEWNSMMVEAAQSRGTKAAKHICRVTYADGTHLLTLKTDQQIKIDSSRSGLWRAKCAKMSCNEILNLTRISIIKNPILYMKDSASNKPLKQALQKIATRTDKHYEGFLGMIRRMLSAFFNLFTTDKVNLFTVDKYTLHFKILHLKVGNEAKRGSLPFIIGNNADFARLVASEL